MRTEDKVLWLMFALTILMMILPPITITCWVMCGISWGMLIVLFICARLELLY